SESPFCRSAAFTGRGETGNCSTVACWPGEQHGLPVGELQRIVMHIWLSDNGRRQAERAGVTPRIARPISTVRHALDRVPIQIPLSRSYRLHLNHSTSRGDK